MSTGNLRQRIQAYQRGQHAAVAIGALPLLSVYFLVHTPWLKTQMQDHKHLMVAALIVLPLAWLITLVHGWKRIGPRLLGIACPACGQTLVDPTSPRVAKPLRCSHCGAVVLQADPSGH